MPCLQPFFNQCTVITTNSCAELRSGRVLRVFLQAFARATAARLAEREGYAKAMSEERERNRQIAQQQATADKVPKRLRFAVC